MSSEVSAPRASFSSPCISRQIVMTAALIVGALALGLGVAALIVRLSPGSAPIAEAAAHRDALPLLPAMAADSPILAQPAPSQIAPFAEPLAPAPPAQDDAIR